MDCIRIKNLKVKARHGVYEFERKKDGTFELDIELYLSLEKSGQSDKLEHTIDYDNIVSIATKAFTGKDYNLVEAAAESVCEKLLYAFKVAKVILRVRKPHAPINAEFDTIEVELIKENEHFK